MVSPLDAPDWFTQFPPPYRLRCDLAVVPLLAPADNVRTTTATEAPTLFGKALVFVLLARYTAAHYGPEQRPYEPAAPTAHLGEGYKHEAELYREVALASPLSVMMTRLSFPILWVESQDAGPLELGYAYGFSKLPASVAWEQTGNRLAVTVEAGRVLDVRATVGPFFPGRWLEPLSGTWAVLPATGKLAPMRLEETGRAALLRVQSLSLPYLTSHDGRLQPLPGLWLRDCVVALGAPQSVPR